MSTVFQNGILVCVLLLGHYSVAQNLVVNPSFEFRKTCPKYLSNFNTDLEDWTTPTRGTTDYFNACGERMGVPNNFNGFQKTKFGKGYAGLYVYAPNDYREYIQAKFVNTLRKGETYKVSFYVSLAEASDFAIKDFRLLFSNQKLHIPTDKNLSKAKLSRLKDKTTYVLQIPSDGFYSESKKWTKISLEFEAKGTENYMSIGNFEGNVRTARVKPKNIGPRPKRNQKGEVSYYYLDMVSVESMDAPIQPVVYELDKPTIFKNVLFAFDDFKLSDGSKQELNRIYAFLEKDEKLLIHIMGHTDNQGTISYNSNLAKKRAKQVSDYLMELGLSKKRISWQGKGGGFPIAENTTESGRQLNRRVEFVISERKEGHLNR